MFTLFYIAYIPNSIELVQVPYFQYKRANMKWLIERVLCHQQAKYNLYSFIAFAYCCFKYLLNKPESNSKVLDHLHLLHVQCSKNIKFFGKTANLHKQLMELLYFEVKLQFTSRCWKLEIEFY